VRSNAEVNPKRIRRSSESRRGLNPVRKSARFFLGFLSRIAIFIRWPKMKTLLIAVLLIGSLQAGESHWKVVSAAREGSVNSGATWVFKIRNTSDREIVVTEDWSRKGKAAANLCLDLGRFGANPDLNLIAEPCHHSSRDSLTIRPGDTVTAVVPAFAGFELGRLNLTIIEARKKLLVAPLSSLTIHGQQAGAGQPATRSESNSEGGDKPLQESEGRSR
jgi:hypothetical protein